MKPYCLYVFYSFLFVAVFLSTCHTAFSQSRLLDKRSFHLRRGSTPEWAVFPKLSMNRLQIEFDAQANATEYTLSLQQEDVKHRWQISLNGKQIGNLYQDENPVIYYWAIPPGVIHTGKNTLSIMQADTIVDDIRVREITLHAMPKQTLLSQAILKIGVLDKQTGTLLPARITITSSGKALQQLGTVSNDSLAVRPGIVYSANGKASFTLPAGKYTIYATRGFEYGVDSVQVVVRPGDLIQRVFTIAREVSTPGWVSSDTHIHTFTYSRHGDASLAERVITIAGEGIELPVLTDHNIHVDIDSVAKALHVRQYFTPVMGNELTTKVGHFNIFPVQKNASITDHKAEDWENIAQDLRSKSYGKIIILNHARDIHYRFRPFGEDRHIASAGMNTDKWTLPANAMEVVNSGSQQNNRMQLFEDWFGMLNRGQFLTPVGSSDSHDVGRYLVGQARTYIRSSDEIPGQINVARTVDNFLAGKVMVSFGLLAQLTVNNSYGPGELVPASGQVKVSVEVLGPSWTQAGKVSLYVNGIKSKESIRKETNLAGIKWKTEWILPASRQDYYLVAIAEGPGKQVPYWYIPNPYQPSSPVWQPGVIGSSGAIWIDGDGDGKRTSAYEYAQTILSASKGDLTILFTKLSAYDQAVALQVASLLQQQGYSLTEPEIVGLLQKASPGTKQGFEQFWKDWQAHQIARQARK